MMRLRSDEPMNPHRWRLMRALANRTLREWREPDEGIWEVRGEPAHFVLSKVMCWVALDRAIALAELDGYDDENLPRWRRERDELRERDPRAGLRPRARGRSPSPTAPARSTRRTSCSPPSASSRPTTRASSARSARRRSTSCAAGSWTATTWGTPTTASPARRRGRSPSARSGSATPFCQIGDVEAARTLFERVAGVRERPRAARRGAHAGGRAARQLPAGLHAHRAHPVRVRVAGRAVAGPGASGLIRDTGGQPPAGDRVEGTRPGRPPRARGAGRPGLHVWMYTGANDPAHDVLVDRVIGEFRTAVLLFFVLSAFLLAAPWVAASRGERPPPHLGRFALRGGSHTSSRATCSRWRDARAAARTGPPARHRPSRLPLPYTRSGKGDSGCLSRAL